MAEQNEQAEQYTDTPTHFLVQLVSGYFAVCESVSLIAPGSDGVPQSAFAELFRDSHLKAVALGRGRGLGRSPIAAVSARVAVGPVTGPVNVVVGSNDTTS